MSSVYYGTRARQIVLASRPDRKVTPKNFRVEEVILAEPADGEVLLAVRYLSLDPYMLSLIHI